MSYRIFIPTIFFLLLIIPVYATNKDGQYDFNILKTIDVPKFKITYPLGAEKEAEHLAADITTLLPAMEQYAGFEFTNLTVFYVKDNSAFSGGDAKAWYYLMQINLTIEASNFGLIAHEICHLSQRPLYFPPWFTEGQATNCEIRNLVLLGRDAQHRKDDYIYWSESNASFDLQTWGLGGYYGDEASEEKSYGEAFLLFQELEKKVDITQFYQRARQDFAGYSEMLPDDAIICKMNEVSHTDTWPIFAKYGFAIKPCNEKTYDFLKQTEEAKLEELKPGQNVTAKPSTPGQEAAPESLTVKIIGVLILSLIFIGIPYMLIRSVWRWLKKKKK